MKRAEQLEKISENKYLQAIEDSRFEFLSVYRKHDIYKKIVFAVCFILMIFCLVVYPNLPGVKDGDFNSITGVQFGGSIAVVVVMFIYGFTVKKLMEKKMRNYFNNFYNNSNEYTLGGELFKNVCLAEPNKITKEEFIENQIYKNIFEVGSRGLTTFEYKNIPISVVDCAAQVKGDKKVTPVFVGKYVRCDCKHDVTNPIIIYLKGTGLVLPPTNIEDKKIVLDNERMTIYTNQENWETVVTKKFLNLLNEVKTNELLVDLTICLNHSKIYVCMGYNDPLMVPPLEHKFDCKPTEEYKLELLQILQIIEELH